MFIEFEDAQSWYTVALDGLRHLETALHTSKRTQISQTTLDRIYGMSPHEWREFLDERKSEHEMFASLALLASFEGSIRRDAERRGSTDAGPDHLLFRAISQEQRVPIAKIFEVWESKFSAGHPLRKQLTVLRSLYSDRNVIAHGKARRGQFTFELIFTKLQKALKKWKDYVPDLNR